MKKLLFALLFLTGPLWSATSTPNMGLIKPADGDTDWGTPLRADFDIIDSSAAILPINLGTSVTGQLPSGNMVSTVAYTTKQNVFTDTNGFQAVSASSLSVNGPLNISGLTANQCVQTGSNGLLSTSGAACGGGGGSSSLAVNQNGVQITSPTRALNGLSPPFLITSVGAGATAQWTLDPSSVTLFSTNVIRLQSTLQPFSTFYVSSGTVSGKLTSGTAAIGTLAVSGAETVDNLRVTGSGGLTIDSLTSGQCVQAGTGGILTVTGSACGTGGGGGGGTSSLEVMGNSVRITSPTATLSLRAGPNITLTNAAIGTTAQITINASSSSLTIWGGSTGAPGVSPVQTDVYALNFPASMYGISNFGGGIASIALLSSQTWTSQHLWSSPKPSTFTYQVQVGSITGAGLVTCGDSSHALAYTGTTGLFSCQSLSGGSGGASGTINAANTYNVPNYSLAGSSTVLSASGNLFAFPSSVTVTGALGLINTYGLTTSTLTVSTLSYTNAIPYTGGSGYLVNNSSFTYGQGLGGSTGIENLKFEGQEPYIIFGSSNAMGINWFDDYHVYANANLWASISEHPNAYPSIAQGNLNIYQRDGGAMFFDVTGQGPNNKGSFGFRVAAPNDEATPRTVLQINATGQVLINGTYQDCSTDGVNQFCSQDLSTVFLTSSTTRGSLPCPPMTTTQKNAIAGPKDGLCVYDMTVSSYSYYSKPANAWWFPGNGTGGGSSGGYSLQPATVTARFDQGATATSLTVTSSLTVTGASLFTNATFYSTTPSNTSVVIMSTNNLSAFSVSNSSITPGDFLLSISSSNPGPVLFSLDTNSNMTVSTITVSGQTFSTLGSSATNGTFKYCSDCTVATPATCTANLLASCVCAGSGTGAFAKRLNGAWYCQ